MPGPVSGLPRYVVKLAHTTANLPWYVTKHLHTLVNRQSREGPPSHHSDSVTSSGNAWESGDEVNATFGTVRSVMSATSAVPLQMIHTVM